MSRRVCILPARICSPLAVHPGIVRLIPASKDAQGKQAAFYSGATCSLVHLGEWRFHWALLCQVASSNSQPRGRHLAWHVHSITPSPRRGNHYFIGTLSQSFPCVPLLPTPCLWDFCFRPGGYLQ